MAVLTTKTIYLLLELETFLVRLRCFVDQARDYSIYSGLYLRSWDGLWMMAELAVDNLWATGVWAVEGDFARFRGWSRRGFKGLNSGKTPRMARLQRPLYIVLLDFPGIC